MELQTFDDTDNKTIEGRKARLNVALGYAKAVYENVSTETRHTLGTGFYKVVIMAIEDEISFLNGDGKEDGISTDEE